MHDRDRLLKARDSSLWALMENEPVVYAYVRVFLDGEADWAEMLEKLVVQLASEKKVYMEQLITERQNNGSAI